MNDLLAIVISIVVVDHFVLAGFARATHAETSLVSSVAVVLLVLVAIVTFRLIGFGILDLTALHTLEPLLLLVTVIGVSSLARMALQVLHPVLGGRLESQRPAILINAVLLTTAINAMNGPGSLIATVGLAVVAGVAFVAITGLFRGLMERVEAAEVPAPFRGPPIGLITAAMMALALGGLAGLYRG